MDLISLTAAMPIQIVVHVSLSSSSQWADFNGTVVGNEHLGEKRVSKTVHICGRNDALEEFLLTFVITV